MIIVPVKWLPYLLVFSGLYAMLGGEDFGSRFTGLLLLVAGGIWIYYRRKGKSNPSEPTVNENKPSPDITKTSVQKSQLTLNTGSMKETPKRICPNCGHSNLCDSIYCEECGERLS